MTTTAKPASDAAPWVACRRCTALIYRKRFERGDHVCPECDWHAPLTARQRLRQLLDPGTLTTFDTPPVAVDPLRFVDTRPYTQRLHEAREKTGLDDAALAARGEVHGHAVIVTALDFRFMGGSLGIAVGETITRAAEAALDSRCPLLIVAASGGARMQEGSLSLMQMAKTSHALSELGEAGILTISLVTDPTYGGVAASFATSTDVILAEPGARLGFAGPRVIEQTIRQPLPAGFQTAEYLLKHGLIDDIQPRDGLRPRLAGLLALQQQGSGHARHLPRARAGAVTRSSGELPDADAWQVVQRVRNSERPTTLDYISYLLEGFHELHGDRVHGDCPALVGGFGQLDGLPVLVLGHQKGHNTNELIERNFGMPSPDGYRKAARLMRLAAKLGVPVVTLIDTPGAYPGIEAEAGGQAMAIAESLRLMSRLPVPIVAVVTGEGGSGGALALGVADLVLMCANGIYSVISPEGCAAILWKEAGAAPEAAASLRLTARELLEDGLIEGIVPEPEGGTHRDPLQAAELLREAIASALGELVPLPTERLLSRRRRRFRSFGVDTYQPAATEEADERQRRREG